MIAIKPYAEIMENINGDEALKKIERAARTCYKSEDKIAEGTAEKMVKNLIKRGHEAMVEHSSFCFELPYKEWRELQLFIVTLETYNNFKSFLEFTNDDRCLISGNVRAWRDLFKIFNIVMNYIPSYFKKFIEENPILFPEFQFKTWYVGKENVCLIPIHEDDLKTKNELLKHANVTVRFVVDRGVSHEIVRHRIASYAQESTRYCNYGKQDNITFILPFYLDYKSEAWNAWKETMETAEKNYNIMIDSGCTPEQARAVLPNSLKTELIMTANLREWRNFFKLRASTKLGKPHPQMREVAVPLLQEMKNIIPVVFDDIEGVKMDWTGNRKAIFSTHGASNHSDGERADLDYYATDPEAVKKLLQVEMFDTVILEPACGGGHIAEVLRDNNYVVVSSDLVNRGYPKQDAEADFFYMKGNSADIITNPPYKLAKEFVKHALDISDDGVKVAMFLKLTFLEGAKRKELFDKYPPMRIYVFRNRVDCWKNGIKPEKASKAVCYAWFVWQKGFTGSPEIRWID